jgi:hypothetical protein
LKTPRRQTSRQEQEREQQKEKHEQNESQSNIKQKQWQLNNFTHIFTFQKFGKHKMDHLVSEV